jgi:hypothetical protein
MTEQRHTPAFESATPDEVLTMQRLAAFSRLMDHAFTVPGTTIKFGVDAVLGLIPGIGDVAANLLSTYLLVEAKRMGVSRWDMARMIGNILVDATVSSVPFAGDIFDVFWRANDRNLAILQEHLNKRGVIIEGTATHLQK